MRLISKPPKVCIVRVPITLCRLQIVQIYEEASLTLEDVALEVMRFLRHKQNYTVCVNKLHQNVVGILQAQGKEKHLAVAACKELEWFTNQIVLDLKAIGLMSNNRLPFNSVQPHGPDGLLFSRVGHVKEVE